MSVSKGVPLAKDEVALLIDLIEANTVITNKATNSANNRLKEVAWSKITDSFNASISSCPRRAEQLKLKWENLKKTARKRSTKIKLNYNKTGGGKPEYIPPNDALDRVASILEATCEGNTVCYGGDAEETQIVFVDAEGDHSGSEGSSSPTIVIKDIAPDEDKQLDGTQVNPYPKKFFFNTPSGNRSISKQKRKLVDDDIRARIARNQAITEFYKMKTKKIEVEKENLELVNKKLKLELEQLCNK